MQIQNKSSIILGLAFFICIVFCSQAVFSQPPVPPDQIQYPDLEFRMPRAERIELQNGMTLFYLEDRELPLVSISALLRTGTMYDPPGKEGVAELTAYLLRTGGTIKIQSDRMDRRLDALAVSPSYSMSLDSASVHFSFLKSDLDACLDLLSQMMMQPAFEEKKLQLALSLKAEDLRRIIDNPQRLAFREFNRLLYPNDPRGRYMTTTSLQKISRDDLAAFHKQYFSPANMMVAVTGDLTKREAIRKVNQYFGQWQQSGRKPDLAPPPANPAGGVFFMNKQLSQSTVVSGELTVGKNDPDFHAFSVLDFIIGSGGFPSRIFTAVRNNEGLAYSAGSFYRARPSYGVFGTYAFTKTESTYQAMGLISSILKDVAAGSITDNELAWAKKSTLNGFIFSFEQPAQIATQQMTIAFEKLPDNYLISYRKQIESVTREDLKRVAAKYLDEKKRLTLILGDTDKFGKLPETWGQPVYISPQL